MRDFSIKNFRLLQFVFVAAIATLPFFAHAQKKYIVQSPNTHIQFSVFVQKQQLFYEVSYKNRQVILPSPLQLSFSEVQFTNNIRIVKTEATSGVEAYELITGKASNVKDNYNALAITIEPLQKSGWQIELVIRAFDAAVAFQYRMPGWPNQQTFSLLSENTCFIPAGNPKISALLLPGYTSSHEGHYTKAGLHRFPSDTLMEMPALFQYPDSIYMAVTEAALVDYAGMYLMKEKESPTFISRLSPLPSDTAIKVKASFPHKSPWRVIMLSDRIGDLFENNVLTSLNEPCKIKNTGWLQPGTTTFPWWNGNVLPDTINAPGNNFVTAKYYIDFCARNNITYHSVVEYGLHQWYVDDGVGFQPGSNPDVTRPVPGLDMKEICDYAHSKGVKVRVWVHWAALYPKLDSAFAIFEKWGLSGMMVDFMDRDDQQMVNIQNEILEKAARHKLHIQFHGSYKPTGLHRTWPNEFTREGTLNYESNKWAGYITPDMDMDIVFTRLLAGSTDYHLGGFRAVPANEIKPNYTRPLMLGTRCHMLAMYVVLENYLQMVCDYPEAYEGQPGFEFIKEIPTTWDETKVPAALPHEYIVMARRKKTDWYLATMTNGQSRKLSVNFSFLGAGNYEAIIYTDAEDVARQPNHLNKKSINVNASTTLDLQLAAGGGTVMVLKKR